MMTLPTITDATIQDRTSERTFERGLSYARDGLVEHMVWRGGLLTAEVLGSEEEPYVVQVRMDSGGIKSAECSCPFDYGGDCKHIVATLLYFSATGDSIEQRPAIEDLIVDLEQDQLKLLVLHLVSRRPRMMDSAERFLATLHTGK